MRLSEAILLGSTVVASKAGGQYFSESRSRCALGMAAIARGCEYGPNRRAIPIPEQDRRTLGTEGVWGSWVMREVVRPCDCWRFRVPHEMRIKDVIAPVRLSRQGQKELDAGTARGLGGNRRAQGGRPS